VNANLLHGFGIQEVHLVRRFEDDSNSETPGWPANQEIVCSGNPGSAGIQRGNHAMPPCAAR
jgi:hypothetical protein